MGYEEWVIMQRRCKWEWAQQLVIKDNHKWSNAVLKWDPDKQPWPAQRSTGRPKRRWTDDLAAA
eukprot:588408-Pyramimonas_sp.AAC.1